MRKRVISQILLALSKGALFTAIIAAAWPAGCNQTEGAKGGGTESAQAAELREYEGQKLSSINDFRENSIKGPQHIDKDDYTLKLRGLVEKPKSYGYDDIVNEHEHHKKVVTLNCVEGWSVTILWEGIAVSDLLEEAEPQSKAKVVIFHAHDGYSTSFPIDYIMENDIIMAHKINGIALPPERGFPFELIAEGKWGYKWVKWITEIELSDDVDYRGFWESRGYSNSANLNEPPRDR